MVKKNFGKNIAFKSYDFFKFLIGRHFENGRRIFFYNELVQAILKINLCAKFDQNRTTNAVVRWVHLYTYIHTYIHIYIHIYIYIYNFERTLKTCSSGQDRCSFHGPGSGSHHEGHCNSSYFLWKFANKSVLNFN